MSTGSLWVNQGEYGADVWCHKALTYLRTFCWTTWPLGSCEVVGFGAEVGWYSILRSLRSDFWDISIANKEAPAEIMPNEERSMILRFPRTGLLFSTGWTTQTSKRVLTYETPCKPKAKDLFALLVYVYLYITSWHHTMAFCTNHFKDFWDLPLCYFVGHDFHSQKYYPNQPRQNASSTQGISIKGLQWFSLHQ